MNTLAAGSKNTLSTRPTRMAGVPMAVWVIIGIVALGVVAGLVFWGSTPSGNVLAEDLSVPLNGATTARIDINTDAGNLTIDRLTGAEQVLASGTLQYFEHQGVPTHSINTSNGQADFTLRGGGTGQSWFTMPWSACSGAYEWQIHLNPAVSSDITAHTGGGNVMLNLAGMAITRVMADSGGGNMDVVLPDKASGLNVKAGTGGGNVTVDLGNGTTGNNTIDAQSGAGNVLVNVPSAIAAKVHAGSGLGEVSVDSRFTKIDDTTYQSPDYASATNKVEITVNSGAGNVSVKTK